MPGKVIAVPISFDPLDLYTRDLYTLSSNTYILHLFSLLLLNGAIYSDSRAYKSFVGGKLSTYILRKRYMRPRKLNVDILLNMR